ncbi:MAG: DJ-1/PfpI family protein [Candidatus Peregrinibacteria bacterium]
MKPLLMLLAPENFRDTEYIVPRAFWEQMGIPVQTASLTSETTGRFGYRVLPDFLLSEVIAEDFSAVFLVGGSGSLVFQAYPEAKKLGEHFIVAQKPVGAICAATQNLLVWGFLAGKNATGWNGDGVFEESCPQYGAIYHDSPVVVDGKICTANGPAASEECALAMGKMLFS